MSDNIVVLISGRGSNLKSLLQADLGGRIVAVCSNRPDAGGLEYARQHGIDTLALDHHDYPSREAFDAEMMRQIDQYAPKLVVLAGYMRLLTETFVNHYSGRLINIHPSLLPAFTGLHTHQRALDEGVKIHGCTVHFVTPELDHGPIIIQAAVGVEPDDSSQSLAARVLQQEHRIFPQAVRWFMQGRLSLHGNRVQLAPATTTTPLALVHPQPESEIS